MFRGQLVPREMEEGKRKALLLSVGYGQGHHSAARALAEELEMRGWCTQTHDPCAETYPRLFRLTQRYYHFCVRKAPWLWGVTYSLTDTADWRRQVDGVLLKKCTLYVKELLLRSKPDVVLCTYPLFAYMLDALAEQEGIHVPYVVVVTDAIEISRPWMKTEAPLVCVIDELSAQIVQQRYALTPEQVVSTGFPVRRGFHAVSGQRCDFSDGRVSVLYAVYRSRRQVCRDVRGLLSAFPRMSMTLLCGERAEEMRTVFTDELATGKVEVVPYCHDMAALFARHHVYIGKAGAATVFEAYASALPMIINYSLPGQEQGNLELVLHDECGYRAESTADAVSALRRMLDGGGRHWREIRKAMESSYRAEGAGRVVDIVESRFFS